MNKYHPRPSMRGRRRYDWWRAYHGLSPVFGRDRPPFDWREGCEIVYRHSATVLLQMIGDNRAKRAAIEKVRPLVREAAQRGRILGLHEVTARRNLLSVAKEKSRQTSIARKVRRHPTDALGKI